MDAATLHPVALPGRLGRRSLGALGGLGRVTLFLARAVRALIPVRPVEVVQQVHFIGNRSVRLIVLTASFTGMVLCIQGANALRRFGGERYVGPLVALGLVRELGPVLGALMVTARAGSAMAAALGSMRVTEQVDALEAMAIDPVNYLVSPRLAAAMVAVPLVTTLFSLVGIVAGWLFGVVVLRLDGHMFLAAIRDTMAWSDVRAGLWKSLVFAVCIAWICTYRGYFAGHGALGVGRATSQAVVETSAVVLLGDYVLTALFF
jgi:phospholipid/cholesterol/gamma-HCH transport system permease protein